MAVQSSLERKVEQIAASLEGDEGLRVRVALVERGLADHRLQSAAQHKEQMEAFAGLRDDLSDQGKAPPPTPKTSGRWTISLAPGTGMELAKLVGSVLTILGLVGSVSYRSAQSGANSAVVAAVEQGQAVPVAAEVLRVMPIPTVVPVPMPMPEQAPPEPHVEAVTDDLMDRTP